MSLLAAERHLLKTHFIGNASFDKYPVGTLQDLCNKYELAVLTSAKRGIAIKKDYIQALHEFVSTGTETSWLTPSSPKEARES